jgi:hypothetical protein
MRDQALRRAAEHTDFTYKRGDASVGGGSPFAGFGWEEVRNDDTQGTTEGEFVPR